MNKQITLSIKPNKYSEFLNIVKNLGYVKIIDVNKMEEKRAKIEAEKDELLQSLIKNNEQMEFYLRSKLRSS